MKKRLPTPHYYVFQANREKHMGYTVSFKLKEYPSFEENILLEIPTHITLNLSLAVCGKRAEPHSAPNTWIGICHLEEPQDAAIALITPDLELMEIMVFLDMKEYTFCLLEMLKSGRLSKKLRTLRTIAAKRVPFINQLILH